MVERMKRINIIECPSCGKPMNIDDLIIENTGGYNVWYMPMVRMLCPACKNEVRRGAIR